MFEHYPKTRPSLPPAFQEIYKQHYRDNRDGKGTAMGVAQRMEQWLHKKVAEDVGNNPDQATLEIGAGTLNQLAYERPKVFDIIEPFEELYQDNPELHKVRRVYADIDEIPLHKQYDRIISVATFEHILDLPKVLAKACLLLKDGGSLRTSIPNEGTILWTLGWKLTTGIEFKLKHGLDYGTLMRHEHVNTASEIQEVLDYFFTENSCKIFGLNKSFAFYRFYESSGPRIDRAIHYLKDKYGLDLLEPAQDRVPVDLKEAALAQ